MTTLLDRLRTHLPDAQEGHVAVCAADLLLLLESITDGTDHVTLSVSDLQHLIDQAAAVAAEGGKSLESYMENIAGRQGPAQLRPLIELSSGQIQELAGLAGDEGPIPLEDQNTYSIIHGNGHSGEGLYAWLSEYPEEGAFFLDGIPHHHREAMGLQST